MSILKQMEEARLTPEEVQELILLLEDSLPKIKKKLDSKVRINILNKNLRETLGADNSVTIPEVEDDLEQGYQLLHSANSKLIKFKELIDGD